MSMTTPGKGRDEPHAGGGEGRSGRGVHDLKGLLLVVVAVPFLLYTPLVLGWMEGKLFGSRNVHRALDSIGVAEFLDSTYPDAVDWGEPFMYFQF